MMLYLASINNVTHKKVSVISNLKSILFKMVPTLKLSVAFLISQIATICKE